MDWTNSKIIGMQCMQELMFWLGELRWDTVTDVFIFVKEKKPQPQKERK